MDMDIRVIMAEFGFKDINGTLAAISDKRRPNEKANKTAALYEDYWDDVSGEKIDTLSEIYYYDFKLFNYPLDPI